MSIVSNVLGILDKARGMIADAGLCPYTVTVRSISWSGNAVGRGTKTVTDTPIYVDGHKNPKVVNIRSHVIMPGGTYNSDEYEIGPVTPPFTGGGVNASVLDPSIGSSPTQLFYLLTGPGLPSGGALFRKVKESFDSPFRYKITVKKVGEEP